MVKTPKPRKPSAEEIARVAAARAVLGMPADPVRSREIAGQLVGEAVSTPQRAETASIARPGGDGRREGN